jgi:MinD superfamily P-loop ATPase
MKLQVEVQLSDIEHNELPHVRVRADAYDAARFTRRQQEVEACERCSEAVQNEIFYVEADAQYNKVTTQCHTVRVLQQVCLVRYGLQEEEVGGYLEYHGPQ